MIRVEEAVLAGVEHAVESVWRALPTAHEQRALTFSAWTLQGQKRRSGDPYILHPYRAAANLNRTLAYTPERPATSAIILLHDAPDQAANYDPKRYREIRQLCGEEFAYALDAAVLLAPPPTLGETEQDVATAAMTNTYGVLAVRTAHVFERRDNAGDIRFTERMPEEARRGAVLHQYSKAVFSNRFVHTAHEVHSAVQRQLDTLGEQYERAFGIGRKDVEERVEQLVAAFDDNVHIISAAVPDYTTSLGLHVPRRTLSLHDSRKEYAVAS